MPENGACIKVDKFEDINKEISTLRTVVAVQDIKIADLERRCNVKDNLILSIVEHDIKPMAAWQNKAIGYSMAFSFIASLIGNYIAGKQ